VPNVGKIELKKDKDVTACTETSISDLLRKKKRFHS
jgi:hypothetical protein